MSQDGTTVETAWLTERVTRIFTTVGVPAEAAALVAEALVDADRRGIPSHGVMLAPMYVTRIRAGSVATHTEPRVLRDAGAVAVLDAGHALGQPIADHATGLAVEKARAHGIGAVTVRHAFHFGEAGRYARAAASAGCVGLVAANTRPLMPAPGGAVAVVGNNPLAIGLPNPGAEPIVLDMALSAGALGKIRLAAAEGRPIPADWATDATGRPTTDPIAAIDGLLLPAGGAKGYGLAFMLDVLTGVLSGGGYGQQVRGLYADATVPNDCAQLFIALDVAAFLEPHEYAARLRDLTSQVTSSGRAPGTDRLLLPGDLALDRYRESAATGLVPVDPTVLAALAELTTEGTRS